MRTNSHESCSAVRLPVRRERFVRGNRAPIACASRCDTPLPQPVDSLLLGCFSLLLIAVGVGCTPPSAQEGGHVTSLQARVVAVGVASDTALRELATFLPEGAGRDDATVAAIAALDGTPHFRRAGVAATLLRRSPSGGAGEVFAVVHADGSVVQVRAGNGVDGLAPTGTVAPLIAPDPLNPGAVSAPTGIIFNWVPDPILYIADPHRNGVVALTLVDDGAAFRVAATRRLEAPELNLPVDLAPAVLESVNPGFSSSTTLAGGADFYVANRGNGTIVRMRQDVSVNAEVRLRSPIDDEMRAHHHAH